MHTEMCIFTASGCSLSHSIYVLFKIVKDILMFLLAFHFLVGCKINTLWILVKMTPLTWDY